MYKELLGIIGTVENPYLKKRLEEFFKYFSDSIYRCEVRSDSCFGGPILTLEDERGLAEIFMVAIAESFDECGDKAT